MPLFPVKKTRKRNLLKSPTVIDRVEGMLEDHRVLPRILLAIAFSLVMLVVLRSWEPIFPYRLGDRANHGLTARVSFNLVNEFATEQLRIDRADQVPPIFRHNPQPLGVLPAKLRGALEEIAGSDDLDDVSEKTRQSFGLVPQPDEAMTDEKVRERYRSLRTLLGVEQGITGRKIEDIMFEFSDLVTPLERFGLIDQADLDRYDITLSDTLAVAPTDGSGEPTAVAPGEVLINELVKPENPFGASFSRYPELNQERELFTKWLTAEARPTLRYDAEATRAAKETARAEAGEVFRPYDRGTLLLEPGGVIDSPVLEVLRAETDELNAQMQPLERILRVGTVWVMLVIVMVLVAIYLYRHEPRLFHSTRRLTVFLASIAVAVGLARWFSVEPWRAEVIPLLAAVMIFALAYNQVLATVCALTLSLVITFSTTADLSRFIVLLAVSITALIPLKTVYSRSTLVIVGAVCGLVYFFATWGTGLLASQAVSDVWANDALLRESLWGFAKCLIAGYLVAGTLPFVEKLFGVITDISLLELSDVSHPLLQELIQKAPGTYNHSVAVATIGEAAADRIGANGLLLRVAAYFHDVGKMLKPQYFIENIGQGRENKHNQLAPAMSTLIIIGHVKDGVDLARQYDLPEQVIDFIEQHHGTTLVEYFYREAMSRTDGNPDHKTEIEESNFRYPGPKPQTKETGVMMLSDAVESASRTLSDPTPKRIESLVHSLTMKRLLDGQFDETPLTLTEIAEVEKSLIKSLTAIYHGRIKYPEPQTA